MENLNIFISTTNHLPCESNCEKHFKGIKDYFQFGNTYQQLEPQNAGSKYAIVYITLLFDHISNIRNQNLEQIFEFNLLVQLKLFLTKEEIVLIKTDKEAQ